MSELGEGLEELLLSGLGLLLLLVVLSGLGLEGLEGLEGLDGSEGLELLLPLLLGESGLLDDDVLACFEAEFSELLLPEPLLVVDESLVFGVELVVCWYGVDEEPELSALLLPLLS